ncbi:3'-5' exoribonuclease [Paenalkalicoccus suaedae]|uniref:3'-5' exoribonuclease n=1 Tax=Paenalkalicoccus suaedae TaxID=2592382 RepID=A0A859FDY9_9BACI|nr:3'-5' exoribonuclease [Paenalkalicoccus suaedae]
MLDKWRFHLAFSRYKKKHVDAYAACLKQLELFQSFKKRDAHLKDITYTVFDLETTGFYPNVGDEILSIGALKMNVNHISFPEQYYELVHVNKPIPKAVQKLTELTNDDCRYAKKFPEVLQSFLEFADNTVLVAHPASFDVVFLKEMCKKWGLPVPPFTYIDSYLVANDLFPDSKNSLDELLERFDINQLERHHALNDALMTADMFTKLIDELVIREINTLEEINDSNA